MQDSEASDHGDGASDVPSNVELSPIPNISMTQRVFAHHLESLSPAMNRTANDDALRSLLMGDDDAADGDADNEEEELGDEAEEHSGSVFSSDNEEDGDATPPPLSRPNSQERNIVLTDEKDVRPLSSERRATLATDDHGNEADVDSEWEDSVRTAPYTPEKTRR